MARPGLHAPIALVLDLMTVYTNFPTCAVIPKVPVAPQEVYFSRTVMAIPCIGERLTLE